MRYINSEMENKKRMDHEYWDGKTSRAVKANDHVCLMDQRYPNDIEMSIRSSVIHDAPENRYDVNLQCGVPCPSNVVLYDMTTADAIFSFVLLADKVCALNFASFKNPGGKFLEGSMAQEESLCHVSTLYNVLRAFRNTFYHDNLTRINRLLYANKAIYSPHIVFADETSTKHATCDIITCAAPNYRAAAKYRGVTMEENTRALYDRCKFVLDVAAEHRVDVLILGAYGCGVFGQDPYMVAKIFKHLLVDYTTKFNKVIFAIPNSGHGTRNFAAFDSVFKSN